MLINEVAPVIVGPVGKGIEVVAVYNPYDTRTTRIFFSMAEAWVMPNNWLVVFRQH